MKWRFRPFRILERLEALACPTLVVWGRNDRGGAPESAAAAVERIPDGRLVMFDDCGHYPMIEHPARYNLGTAAFLAAARPQSNGAGSTKRRIAFSVIRDTLLS